MLTDTHKHTRLLTPKDVAVRYALHPHTVSKHLCGQALINLPPAFKVSGGWRFREDDVDAHIDKLSGRHTAQASAGAAAVTTAEPPTSTKRKPGRPRKSAQVFKQGAAA